MPSSMLAAITIAALGCALGTEPEGEGEPTDEIAIHLTVETTHEPRLVRRLPGGHALVAAEPPLPPADDGAVMCMLE